MDVEQEIDETTIPQKCLLLNPINNLIPINYFFKNHK